VSNLLTIKNLYEKTILENKTLKNEISSCNHKYSEFHNSLFKEMYKMSHIDMIAMLGAEFETMLTLVEPEIFLSFIFSYLMVDVGLALEGFIASNDSSNMNDALLKGVNVDNVLEELKISIALKFIHLPPERTMTDEKRREVQYLSEIKTVDLFKNTLADLQVSLKQFA